MNRREFCQTTALFLAGTACAVAAPRSEKQTIRFRLQKILLESWDTKNVCEDSPHTTAFVRTQLECVQRSGCNGVLLVPGSPSVSRWTQKIVSEAARFHLMVFVPACLDRDSFNKAQTVVPLSHEAGTLQTIDGIPAENGGFLLIEEANGLLGLLLYDSSRCLWTSFAPYCTGIVQNFEYGVNDTRLMTARWIDHFIAKQEPQT